MARLKKNQVSQHRKQGRRLPTKKKQTSGGVGLVIGTLIAAALIAAIALYLRTPTSSVVHSFDLSGLPLLGQAEAPVSMVVVEDFKCPACRTFEQTVMPQLAQTYVAGGQLKVASLIWPFLAKANNLPVDDSLLAAEATECVYDQQGNAGYQQFKTVLFDNQADERSVWATKDTLKTLAAKLGQIDQARFDTCLESDATRSRVQSRQKQITAAGVTSTPSVFINGRSVPPNFADISAAIDGAAQAKP